MFGSVLLYLLKKLGKHQFQRHKLLLQVKRIQLIDHINPHLTFDLFFIRNSSIRNSANFIDKEIYDIFISFFCRVK